MGGIQPLVQKGTNSSLTVLATITRMDKGHEDWGCNKDGWVSKMEQKNGCYLI